MRSGLLIAVVGPDAAGKTTTARKLKEELARMGPVHTAHLGWPPPTHLSGPLRITVRLLRKVLAFLKGHRSAIGNEAAFPRIQSLLHLLTSWERRALARTCQRLSRNGAIVITDRYPGIKPGSSSGLSPQPASSRIGQLFHRCERAIYRSVPEPDVVIRIRAPLEVCLQRNRERPEPKPDHVIRSSHLLADSATFVGSKIVDIDGTRAPNANVEDVLRRLDAKSHVRSMSA